LSDYTNHELILGEKVKMMVDHGKRRVRGAFIDLDGRVR